jgi:hypothetical protein
MSNKRSNKEIRGTVSLYSSTNTRLAQKNFFRIRHCKYIVEEWEVFYGVKFKDYYYQVAFHLEQSEDDHLDNLINAVANRKKSGVVYNSEVLYL